MTRAQAYRRRHKRREVLRQLAILAAIYAVALPTAALLAFASMGG